MICREVEEEEKEKEEEEEEEEEGCELVGLRRGRVGVRIDRNCT